MKETACVRGSAQGCPQNWSKPSTSPYAIAKAPAMTFFLVLNAGQESGSSAETRDLDPSPPNISCCVCYAYRGDHFPTVKYSPLGWRGDQLCLPAQPIALGCAMAVAG